MDKVVDSVVLRAFDLYKQAYDIPSDYQLCENLNIIKETKFKRIVRKGDDFKIIGTVLGKLT